MCYTHTDLFRNWNVSSCWVIVLIRIECIPMLGIILWILIAALS